MTISVAATSTDTVVTEASITVNAGMLRRCELWKNAANGSGKDQMIVLNNATKDALDATANSRGLADDDRDAEASVEDALCRQHGNGGAEPRSWPSCPEPATTAAWPVRTCGRFLGHALPIVTACC